MSFSERIRTLVEQASEVAPDAAQAVAGVAAAAALIAKGRIDSVTHKVGQPAQSRAEKLAALAHADALGPSAPSPAVAKRGVTDEVGKPVDAEVKISGKPLKDVAISRMLARLAVNEIPSGLVELSLPTEMHDDFTQINALLQSCAVGKSVELIAQGRPFFAGLVAGVRMDVRGSGRRLQLKIKPALQGLKATRRSRVFEKGSDRALIKQVLGEHGVKVKAIEGIEGEHDQRVQWNCSDWELVRGLMGLYGVWLWPDGTGAVTIGGPVMTGKTHSVAAAPGKIGVQASLNEASAAVSMQALHWEFSALNLPGQVMLTGWDIGKQSRVIKTAKKVPLGTGGLDPTVLKPLTTGALANWEIASLAGMDATTQQGCASGHLLAQQAQALRAQVVLEGVKPYGLRERMSLTGIGTALSGTGLITALEYEFEGSQRTTTTTVWMGLDEERAKLPELPVPEGLMVGKVAAFKPDPKKDWNRLPVTVPLLGKGTLWARWASPYASTDSGLCFYPEKDDEVVVGFLGGDPVILGAMHNPIQKAPFAPSAKNARKGVVLRRGDQVAELGFDRDMREAVWRIGKETAPEQVMTLDARKGVSVQSAVGDVKVEVKKGNVQWHAKTGAAMTTDAKLVLQAKTGVSIKSDKDVEIAAMTRLTGTGKQTVRFASEEGKLTLKPIEALLQGAKVVVKGNAEATLQSTKTTVKGAAVVSVEGAKATLKGMATTEVNSSGIVNVNGALVNLG